MKKTIIFILTIITVLTAFALPVFAEDEASNGVFESASVSVSESKEVSSDAESEASAESVPTTGEADASDAEEAEDDDMNVELKISTENMGTTLKHMGIGMLGVMLVLALIAIVVLILNKLFK